MSITIDLWRRPALGTIASLVAASSARTEVTNRSSGCAAGVENEPVARMRVGVGDPCSRTKARSPSRGARDGLAVDLAAACPSASRHSAVRGGGSSISIAGAFTRALGRAKYDALTSSGRSSCSDACANGAALFVFSGSPEDGSWPCSPHPHDALHAARPCALRSLQQQPCPGRVPHAQFPAALVPQPPQHDSSSDRTSSVAPTAQHDEGLT